MKKNPRSPQRFYQAGLHFAICMAAITAFTEGPDGQPTMRALDPANLDTTVQPCQDFFRYANGGWLDRNPVPAAYSAWGSFNELQDRNYEFLKAILENAASKTNAPKGSNVQLVGDFFASGMDSVRAEADGFMPIAEELSRIDGIKGSDGLKKLIAHLHRIGFEPLFLFSSVQDFKNSEMVIADIDQSGLTLPDRDYYTKEDDRSQKIREEYVSYITRMFRMLGDDSTKAASEARTVLAFESRLASASMTRVDRRDPEKVYHKMTIDELGTLTPVFSWKNYVKNVERSNIKDVNLEQPEFIKEVDRMVAEVPLQDWKVYLRWQLLDGAASQLDSAFVNEHFRFHGTVLTGAKELLPRWKRVLRTVNVSVGMALGQLYVDRAFKPEAKLRAQEMVRNLEEAFREHIQTLTWMTETTKKQALKKLDAIVNKIGYPDKWRDYSKLRIDRGVYLLNILRANRFEFDRQLSKIDKPVDRAEWLMTPPTVNAYYNPLMNEIVFPAGILQPPFFNPDADDAVNYGGMGAVIGHELTHGFDDQGRKFDAKGNLTDWWTKTDEENFEKRASAVENQFDQYVVLDSLHVNGKLTLGENIADLGGLSIAYTALENTLKDNPRPQIIDGFTPEQRFFLGWAQIWRANYRPEERRRRIIIDPHAPNDYLTIGPLSNMPQFSEAFSCTLGNEMIRADSLRANIW